MTPEEQRDLATLLERSDHHAIMLRQHGKMIDQLQEQIGSLTTSRDLAKQERQMIIDNQKRIESMIQRLSNSISDGMKLFQTHMNDTKNLETGYRKSILTGIGVVFGSMLGAATAAGIGVAKILGLL